MSSQLSKNVLFVTLSMLIAAALAPDADAATLFVGPSRAHLTINSAIAAASNGDTIIVYPGAYPETVRFNNKNIVIESIDPNSVAVVLDTLIDGENLRPCVEFGGSETGSALLRGFTLRGGRGTNGSAIVGNGTQARIERNIIHMNQTGTAQSPGNGTIWNCAGVIDSNLIFDNVVIGSGGAIVFASGPIRNNIIAYNSATIGGGLASCYGPIQNNSIFNNTASERGGGMADVSGQVVNQLVWNNEAPTHPQISNGGQVIYSLVQGGHPGAGNLNQDPRLMLTTRLDCRPTPASPLIDAGALVPGLTFDFKRDPRPTLGYREPRGDGSRYDIGAYEFIPGRSSVASWTLYR